MNVQFRLIMRVQNFKGFNPNQFLQSKFECIPNLNLDDRLSLTVVRVAIFVQTLMQDLIASVPSRAYLEAKPEVAL